MEIIDLFSSRRSHSAGGARQLDVCRVEPWGLSLECPTPEDPLADGEVTWLMADLGLKLTRFRPRRRHSRRGPSLLTAVHVERDTRSWTTTDLLLGLEVPDRGPARIAHYEEFAEAVQQGMIRLNQADYALRTVHRTLEEVSLHRDLNQWLAHRGIFEIW